MSFPPFDIYVNMKMIDVCKYFCWLLLNFLVVDATHSTCTFFIVGITLGSIVLCMPGCLNLLHGIFLQNFVYFVDYDAGDPFVVYVDAVFRSIHQNI